MFIVLCVISIFSFSINAAELLPHDLQLLIEMKEELFKICTVDNKFQFNRVIEIEHEGGVVEFNCNAQLQALFDTYKVMQAKADSLAANDVRCIAGKPMVKVGDNLLPAVDRILQEDTVCKIKSSDKQCGLAFTCTMLLGPFSNLLKYVDVSDPYWQQVKSDCVDIDYVECVGAALKGVWDNLEISAEAIWKLLGMAKDGVVWVGKKGYDYTIGALIDLFSDVEEVSSDQLLVATSVEPGLWEELKKDPVKVAKELAQGFFKVLVDGIKSHYGCLEWSGKPYISDCIRPMQDWDCATCRQKMNSICGVLGFAGGELVVAYLTGGATVAAKKMGEYAYKGGSALVNKVLSPFRTIPKFSATPPKVARDAFDLTTDVAGVAVKTSYKVTMKMKLRDFFEAAGVIAEQAGKTVLNSNALKIVTKGTKTILTPIRKYIELTDRAFLKGYEHAGLAFKSVESHALPRVVSFVKKYGAQDPEFIQFISAKEIGINIKTYGSYVASFDRGKRGREEKDISLKVKKSHK